MSQNDLAPTDSAPTHNVRTMLCNILCIALLSPKKLLKVGLYLLVCHCCDEFHQATSGWLISYICNCIGESIWNQRHVYWICD